jgi:hypothetical protein
MVQLEKYHLISQEYLLSIPYLCQIYHLLNLKHLESVHGFSLNNLKVVDVRQLEATAIGEIITFQTILDSPFNLLRIWRQAVVEGELILHLSTGQKPEKCKIPRTSGSCPLLVIRDRSWRIEG